MWFVLLALACAPKPASPAVPAPEPVVLPAAAPAERAAFEGLSRALAEQDANTGIAAYAHALDVWGKSGKFDVVVPYAGVSGSAELAGQKFERDVTGFGDPRFRFSVNLYGAPALSLPEFASYKQDVIVGASLQVSAPLGQYDPDRLLNIGTNRWAIKPELGVSKALGPLILELAASASFYTDNDDFFGGQTRSQDPLYSLQGHVIYSLRSGIWVAVRIRVADVEQVDEVVAIHASSSLLCLGV